MVQTRPPERIVVALRNDDGPSLEVAHRMRGDGAHFDIATVDEPGAVAAITAGLRLCDEDIVAHIDDDAVAHRNWLQVLVAQYADGVGGVGGRDIVEAPSQTSMSADGRIGRVTWFGRLHGNHHLGTGPARDVDVLKGVSISLRRDLWHLDPKLRGAGAQVHWEVGLCLRARKEGWRLVYEPAALVDHEPGPRFDADARTGRSAAASADAEWNYAYTVAKWVPAARLPFVAAYALLIGSTRAPGLLRVCLRAVRARQCSRSFFEPAAAHAAARLSGLGEAVADRFLRPQRPL